MNEIVYNAIRTPDGTILESRHRHDYREYTDKNGYEYIVDGGRDYIRRGWSPDAPDYEELSLYSDDPHEKIRERVSWGTYGENGKQELDYILIKDMTSDHIKACLANIPSMAESYRAIMENELEYRETTGDK